MVLSNIQGFVSHSGLLAPDNCWDVLGLEESGLCDRPTLMERGPMLINDRSKADSRAAEGFRWEEHLHISEEESESLHVARARVHELKAYRALLTTWVEQAMAERDTFGWSYSPVGSRCSDT